MSGVIRLQGMVSIEIVLFFVAESHEDVLEGASEMVCVR
jgi:hypothetical protein